MSDAMKRFVAVPKEFLDPYSSSGTWVIWDWKKQKKTFHPVMYAKWDAKRLARKLNKHEWLVDHRD
jgi:hypothetical protein